MHDVMGILTPPRFLTMAGSLLVLMGFAGLTGFLGRLSSASVFHPPYWINGVHLAFGSVLLSVAVIGAQGLQTGFVLGGTIAGLTLGTAGLLFGAFAARRFGKPELADPSDHLAHFIVGVLALWAWLNR
jgi:hypothetical protein